MRWRTSWSTLANASGWLSRHAVMQKGEAGRQYLTGCSTTTVNSCTLMATGAHFADQHHTPACFRWLPPAAQRIELLDRRATIQS